MNSENGPDLAFLKQVIHISHELRQHLEYHSPSPPPTLRENCVELVTIHQRLIHFAYRGHHLHCAEIWLYFLAKYCRITNLHQQLPHIELFMTNLGGRRLFACLNRSKFYFQRLIEAWWKGGTIPERRLQEGEIGTTWAGVFQHEPLPIRSDVTQLCFPYEHPPANGWEVTPQRLFTMIQDLSMGHDAERVIQPDGEASLFRRPAGPPRRATPQDMQRYLAECFNFRLNNYTTCRENQVRAGTAITDGPGVPPLQYVQPMELNEEQRNRLNQMDMSEADLGGRDALVYNRAREEFAKEERLAVKHSDQTAMGRPKIDDPKAKESRILDLRKRFLKNVAKTLPRPRYRNTSLEKPQKVPNDTDQQSVVAQGAVPLRMVAQKAEPGQNKDTVPFTVTCRLVYNNATYFLSIAGRNFFNAMNDLQRQQLMAAPFVPATNLAKVMEQVVFFPLKKFDKEDKMLVLQCRASNMHANLIARCIPPDQRPSFRGQTQSEEDQVRLDVAFDAYEYKDGHVNCRDMPDFVAHATRQAFKATGILARYKKRQQLPISGSLL